MLPGVKTGLYRQGLAYILIYLDHVLTLRSTPHQMNLISLTKPALVRITTKYRWRLKWSTNEILFWRFRVQTSPRTWLFIFYYRQQAAFEIWVLEFLQTKLNRDLSSLNASNCCSTVVERMPQNQSSWVQIPPGHFSLLLLTSVVCPSFKFLVYKKHCSFSLKIHA